MKTLYFADGKFLGEGNREGEIRPTGLIYPDSVVMVCPTCGEAWGRIQVLGRPWYPYSRSCIKHPRFPSEPAGSLFFSWESDHNNDLPVGAMNREVVVHANHWLQTEGHRAI